MQASEVKNQYCLSFNLLVTLVSFVEHCNYRIIECTLFDQVPEIFTRHRQTLDQNFNKIHSRKMKQTEYITTTTMKTTNFVKTDTITTLRSILKTSPNYQPVSYKSNTTNHSSSNNSITRNRSTQTTGVIRKTENPNKQITPTKTTKLSKTNSMRTKLSKPKSNNQEFVALGEVVANPIQQLEKAKSFFDSGNYNEAVKLCNSITYNRKAKSNSKILAETNFILGCCCRSIQNYPRAIAKIQESIQLEPNIDKLYILAECYLEMGNYTEAEKQFLKVLHEEDGHELIYDTTMYLVDIYEKQKEYEKAIEVCKNLVEIDSCVTGSYVALGYCYELIEDKNNAIKCYTKALQVDAKLYDPDIDANIRACINLANIFNGLNDHNKGLEFCQSAVNKENVSETLKASIFQTMAESYMGLKEWDNAIECLYSVKKYGADVSNEMANIVSMSIN